MPLLAGKENIGKNVDKLKKEGRKPSQALAIALQKAKVKPKRDKKKFKKKPINVGAVRG